MTIADAMDEWANLSDEPADDLDLRIARAVAAALGQQQPQPKIVVGGGGWHIQTRESGPLRQPYEPPPATTPPVSVWVAIAVATKAIVVQDRRQAPSVSPMGQGGKLSIFAQGPPVTQESFAAEVIAVTADRETCEQAVAAHTARNGGFEYKIGEHPVGWDAEQHQLAEVQRTPCVDCGIPVSDGTSFCQPCRQKRFNVVKEADPGDMEAARRNTYTPPQDRSGRGRGY